MNISGGGEGPKVGWDTLGVRCRGEGIVEERGGEGGEGRRREGGGERGERREG